MISKISLHKIATYADPVEIHPTEINYFYGSNGSGKTTLSNVIANREPFIDCTVTWHANPTETLVYNKNFVQQNFGQSKALKGIFTLGKSSVDAVATIAAKKDMLDILMRKNNDLRNTLTEKEALESQDANLLAEKCWNVKNKFEEKFKPAYSGFMGSKKSFFERCLLEKAKNDADLLSQEDLFEKCDRIFNSSIKIETEFEPLNFAELAKKESAEILAVKLVGKEDSYIGELLKRLGNTDWVKRGVDYLELSNDVCPFCQQQLSSAFKTELEAVFDKTYLEKFDEINYFKLSYIEYIEKQLNLIRAIAKVSTSVYNPKNLIEQGVLLNEMFKSNLLIIEDKLSSPSLAFEIKSLASVLAEIKSITDFYLSQIRQNNNTFNNLQTEQVDLKKQIWHFTVDYLSVDIKNYLESKENYSKAKEKITDRIRQNKNQIENLEKEIRTLESEVTNVTHTINEINRILQLFSFTNFKLAEAPDKGFYKIIREDGSEAKQTLSEGESTFITFLYFYQLIKGSTESSGVHKDKIVVFDDPISSLDSSVLFVVSSLIKDVISHCKTKKHDVKQVFVLTHNIYFYKEITHKGGRNKNPLKEESFWIVKKVNGKTKISIHQENPIKTTYELLWREIADINAVNKVTIFNTLRRILEYYFNIIGGLDYESCINQFDGEEKFICKSLVAWVNDGSHFINEDLVVHTDYEEIQKYLHVFKVIFEKMDHKSHYDMMISSCGIALSPAATQ